MKGAATGELPCPESPPTASGSTTRRRERARRSSSSTSSRATTRAGTSRCGSSPGATAPSPTTRAATRRRTCRTDRSAYSQDRAADDIRGMLDHLGIAEGPHLRAVDGRLRDAASSASAIRSARSRWRWRARATAACRRARARSGRTSTAPRGASTPRAWRRSRSSMRGPDARAVHGQGPEGLAGVPRPVRRPVGEGPRAHHARGADARPSIFELEAAMERLEVPTLIMTGDEDEPCLEPASS